MLMNWFGAEKKFFWLHHWPGIELLKQLPLAVKEPLVVLSRTRGYSVCVFNEMNLEPLVWHFVRLH